MWPPLGLVAGNKYLGRTEIAMSEKSREWGSKRVLKVGNAVGNAFLLKNKRA